MSRAIRRDEDDFEGLPGTSELLVELLQHRGECAAWPAPMSGEVESHQLALKESHP
jgi:hypothetical protein